MHDKKYTFPVMIGEAYTKQLLPRITLGQEWIVDKTGAVRLQHIPIVSNSPQAEVDAAIRKLLRVAVR
jgi:hypothetical protein